MRAGPSSPFPTALYAGLLLALIALWGRKQVLGIEQRLRGFTVWPLRICASWSSEVQAAEEPDEAAQNALAAKGRELVRRLETAAAALPLEVRPSGYEPLVCRVVEHRQAVQEKSSSLLVLDVAPAVLAECLPFVTLGANLVGFLETCDGESGVAVAMLHRAAERSVARVGPRRVFAEFPVSGSGPMLRCLVEPARVGEPWLLRCLAIEDPYRASSVTTSGAIVRTAHLDGDLAGVPAGLVLGELRVRGFETQGRAVPIGLYVRPLLQLSAISAVTLWRQRALGSKSDEAGVRTGFAETHVAHPAALMDLPAPPPTNRSWFLSTQGGLRLARGAAVLRHGALAGFVLSSGSGYAIAAPLGAPTRFSVLWMSSTGDAAPIELMASTVAVDGGLVTLAIEGESSDLPTKGSVWTGAIGPHCPAGIPIGEIVASDQVAKHIRDRTHAGESGALVVLSRKRGMS